MLEVPVAGAVLGMQWQSDEALGAWVPWVPAEAGQSPSIRARVGSAEPLCPAGERREPSQRHPRAGGGGAEAGGADGDHHRTVPARRYRHRNRDRHRDRDRHQDRGGRGMQITGVVM